MVRGETKKTFSIRSKKKVKSDTDRTSTGSTDQRPTVKVYLPNGEFRSVKCGDTTDIKVSFPLVCLLYLIPKPKQSLNRSPAFICTLFGCFSNRLSKLPRRVFIISKFFVIVITKV